MKVLIIGSGGREHALAWKCSQSPRVSEVLAAPGSDAIETLLGCRSVDVPESDHVALVALAQKEAVDLTIVGPEVPLVAGIVDVFKASGLRVFGPSKKAAQLEGSKEFAKNIMKKYNIPTAEFKSFTDLQQAKAYVEEKGAPIVVKADGLAAGKGVVVAETIEEAHEALESMMSSKAFGAAGESVVIEECLVGEELSFMALVNGSAVVPLVTAQDHKRAYEGDLGPNTGGMGAYSPVPHLEGQWVQEAEKTILRPMAEAMVAEGVSFQGVLYAGLMITNEGPKVIEFNARFGDPETQVVLPRMESDLVDIIESVLDGNEPAIKWSTNACVGVVLASEGYPGSYDKGVPFTLPETNPTNQIWFHAGSKKGVGSTDHPEVVAIDESVEVWETNGGRVLLLASLDTNLQDALNRTYETLQKSDWDGLFYRRDIAHQLITDSSN